MMEIQSESEKLEVMIIPSTSPEIHAKPHYKSPTSHPHSNENQNRNTHNSNTISHSGHETAYLIIPNPAPPFKSQFYLHYLIITIPANPTVSTSYSRQISQSNTEYSIPNPPPKSLSSTHKITSYHSTTVPKSSHPWKTRIPLIQHQHISSFTSNHSTNTTPTHISHPNPSKWRRSQSPIKQH